MNVTRQGLTPDAYETRYNINGLTHAEVIAVLEAATLFRKQVLKEIDTNNKAYATQQMDESKYVEDMMFLGGQLAKAAAMEFSIREAAEL